jgi:A/G-specific adenine glycosylase
MNSASVISTFRTLLVDWYGTHQRDLPWRQTIDPYPIWLSEIILQQTRIEQGLSYYHRFINTFPTVKELADAPLTEVLKCWQGLGYYSRARNLHETAKHIAFDLGGIFPETYQELLTLKGVGAYTAAAIASFAYKQVHAVVDGNVYRVLARVFLIDTPIHSTLGKKQFAELAENLIDPTCPDTYNQAIMDFGATQCTPGQPDCNRCPLAEICLAYKNDSVVTLPVRKTEAPKRERFFTYFVCRNASMTWLRERLNKDVWQHLWEFPLVETAENLPIESLLELPEAKALLGKSPVIHTPVQLKHVLSHQLIHARFIPVDVTFDALPGYTAFTPEQLSDLPVSRLIDRFLEH